MEEVFQQLKCSKEGLTTADGEQRLKLFGPNKLEEKKVHLDFFDSFIFYKYSSL